MPTGLSEATVGLDQRHSSPSNEPRDGSDLPSVDTKEPSVPAAPVVARAPSQAESVADLDVIEILSDDDTYVPETTPNEDDIIVINDDTSNTFNENDDLQITGSNPVPGFSRPDRIRRRTPDNEDQSRTFIRRRTSASDDDDVEIINERPAVSGLRYVPNDTISAQPYMNNADTFRQTLLRRIETPVGMFESQEDVPTASANNTRPNWYTMQEPPSNPAPRRPLGGAILSLRDRENGARSGRSARNLRRIVSPGTVLRLGAQALEQFELPQFIFEHLRNRLVANNIADDYGIPGFFGDGADTNNVEGSIMERIERDNEHALDRRLQQENVFNKKTADDKKQVAKNEIKGFTNDIKHDDNAVCVICGVTLGEGIPDDFTPNLEYDAKVDEYSQQFKVPAPWFCIKQCFDTDIAFSKRVFYSKCGHVFCGRCVKAIIDRPKTRPPKKDSIDNPERCAPRKCPVEGCRRQFARGGKKSFQEVYY